MKFKNLLISTVCISIFCGMSYRANCEITPENCKPFNLAQGEWLANEVREIILNYIDCNGAIKHFFVDPNNIPSDLLPLFAQAGTHLEMVINSQKDKEGRPYRKNFPIGNGAIITCRWDFPPPRRRELICESSPQNPDCKALNVIYEDAHFWASVDYQPCMSNGGITTSSVETGGSTFLVQPGTNIQIGPWGTGTNYKNLPIGNGLKMKCSGLEGSSGTCVAY